MCSNLEGRGLQPPVKDRDTLIEQSVTRINEAHRIIVKQVQFMKQIRTVKHNFNTTGSANCRIQLAVPPSIKNNYNNNHNNTVLKKKLTNNYTKKLGLFNWSSGVGTIIYQKKVLKQARVVHNIKSQ